MRNLIKFIKRKSNPYLKPYLIPVGIGAIALILVLLATKWPTHTEQGPGKIPEATSQRPETGRNKAEQPLPPPANSPSTPVSTIGNQVKPKMSFPKDGIPVLMYHSISTIPGNSLGVPVKQFSEEMEWLHRQNYHSLSIEEFYQALAKKAPVPEKPILLTFDDGYSDNYSSAWPILHEYGFRGTFFIVTNSVGPGMMNWDQLADLSRNGNSIESHTVHHLDLAALSSKQQEAEIGVAKQELESYLDIKVQALCFPSGRYNQTTLELMPKLGYTLGFTTKPGNVHIGDNPLTLNRVRISGGMPIAAFRTLFP